MRFVSRLLSVALLAGAATAATPAADSSKVAGSSGGDTLRVALPIAISVSGTRLHRDSVAFPFEKNRFTDLLQTDGFALIQKGVYFAQDIYAEGFKREDIAIIIDGERYHNACPNRMDNPLARTNPLDMSSISLERSSANPRPGLGGTVSFAREVPGIDRDLRVGASTVVGASPARDVAVSLTANKHRISAQYAEGNDYEDGDGRDFTDNYGYRDNFTYRMGEIGLTGARGDWQYRAELMYTQDVMFPYLMMDERDVRVLNSSLTWRTHRLYITHTDHLMDNGLRQASGLMETDARNLTVGFTGPSYEFVARRWDADNRIVMPMASIANHIIPELRTYSGAVWKRSTSDGVTGWGRLGLSHTSLGDKSQESFYAPLFGGIGDDRTFLTYAAGVSRHYRLARHVTGSSTLDVVSEPPAPEQLFLAYRAPMGNPWWSGNPSLKAPVRAGLRTSVTGYGLRAEFSGSHVWNYVEQVAARAGARAYRTYRNVDAVLLSAGLSGTWTHFEFNAAYTHASNTGSDSALVEIAPLTIVSRVKVPVGKQVEAFVRHTYNDAQTRIDESLGETATPAWHRLDLGARLDISTVSLGFEIRNLTNELYYQHLSYARNPYASGDRLYEPGLTVSLSLLMMVGQ